MNEKMAVSIKTQELSIKEAINNSNGALKEFCDMNKNSFETLKELWNSKFPDYKFES